MKKWIQEIIENFIREYEQHTETKWGSPIVGFADAKKLGELKELVSPEHGMPQDMISDATVVIAYFVPFLKEMADTNKFEGLSSPEWAQAYEETNIMLTAINEHIIGELKNKGYDAAMHHEAGRFNKEKLISNWSQRHIAFEAGLGTFGMNNMLITEKGCCGRYSTVITNLDVTPDSPQVAERCLYKSSGKCGACMKKCPKGALTPEGFDRHKCYEMCLENAEIYTAFGSSYTTDDEEINGSEVCGKCVAGMPCAFL